MVLIGPIIIALIIIAVALMALRGRVSSVGTPRTPR
jgi:hypothetical protein